MNFCSLCVSHTSIYLNYNDNKSTSSKMLHSLNLTVRPLKIGHPKKKVVFQSSIFSCKPLVSGRVINSWMMQQIWTILWLKSLSLWHELCQNKDFFKSELKMGPEPKNRGFYPQIIHLFIGFSIIFTIHFGVPSLKLTANAPGNGWLEYFLVSFWDGLFSGANS